MYASAGTSGVGVSPNATQPHSTKSSGHVLKVNIKV